MLGIGVAGWIATIIWELRLKDPVIDFRLLGNRNFAIASVLFFVFGFGLFGSTTLIPQMLQSLYGYRAIDAGLVLGPGALVITLFAPIGAQLIQRQLSAAPACCYVLSLALTGAAAMVVLPCARLILQRLTTGTTYSRPRVSRAGIWRSSCLAQRYCVLTTVARSE